MIEPTSRLVQKASIIFKRLMLGPRRVFSTKNIGLTLETIDNAGVVTIRREKSLNCFDLSMVQPLLPQLVDWETQKALVIMRAAGDKAFCAGGDVKTASDKVTGPIIFKVNYTILNLISEYRIPFITLINGLALGGGNSLSALARFSVVTERAVQGMPETRIGLIPEAGASHYMSRIPGNIGVYLGLTGYKLKGSDVVRAGLATHYVSSARLNELETLLTQCSNDAQIKSLLDSFCETGTEFSLTPFREMIDYSFGADTVEEIVERLMGLDNDWARRTVKTLKDACPGSLKIALRSFRKGVRLDVSDCLKMEYRVCRRLILNHDFPEGVRALMVEKDNKPQWNPSCLADVSQQFVNNHFEPLPEDMELHFDYPNRAKLIRMI